MTKKLKIAFVLNTIIAILTLIATIIMFTGFSFMKNYDLGLEATKISMLKFFTVQSNILMGLVALLFSYKEYKIITGKEKIIRKRYYVAKLMSTTAVALTFFVVFLYLAPLTKYGYIAMIANSNLFYHLIIPVLSIITFVFFEKNNKINFKDTLYGLLPVIVYSFFYVTNILIHMENGKVSPIYDWYWFVQNGVWTIIIVGSLMLLITYLISLGLWKLNKVK